MHNMNQWVPAPTPSQGVSYQSGPSGGQNTPAQDGIVFKSQVRDQTGASGGSASGVYTSDVFQNPAAKGLRLFVNIATGAATGTVTIKLQAQSPDLTFWDVSGATTAALAGNTTGAVYTIYPAMPTGAASAQQHVGSRWRLVATLANAPATFAVGADYLL